jgi:hypothetical protein
VDGRDKPGHDEGAPRLRQLSATFSALSGSSCPKQR